MPTVLPVLSWTGGGDVADVGGTTAAVGDRVGEADTRTGCPVGQVVDAGEGCIVGAVGAADGDNTAVGDRLGVGVGGAVFNPLSCGVGDAVGGADVPGSWVISGEGETVEEALITGAAVGVTDDGALVEGTLVEGALVSAVDALVSTTA